VQDRDQIVFADCDDHMQVIGHEAIDQQIGTRAEALELHGVDNRLSQNGIAKERLPVKRRNRDMPDRSRDSVGGEI
jgi:hypothetical protein